MEAALGAVRAFEALTAHSRRDQADDRQSRSSEAATQLPGAPCLCANAIQPGADAGGQHQPDGVPQERS
jgi:hypothetical protein